MTKWLVVLLSLASSVVWAAEPIEHNGKNGVFIEEAKARELLEKVSVELPSVQKQNELLRKQVELQSQLLDIAKKKYETEQQISLSWQENYESIAQRIEALNEQDRFHAYVGWGIFVGGVLVGAATVYLSSLVLENVSTYRSTT